MRVISGSAKGRKLLTLPGDRTRPILGRVRTALFDTIRPYLPATVFLDLFAGTGSVGIEALSQGAAFCTFVDRNRQACEIIRKNLETTNFTSQSEVIHGDAFAILRGEEKSYDWIYVAPPQYQGLWIQALYSLAERPDLLKQDGRIIAQIDPKEYDRLELAEFAEVRQKRYGNTLLLFYGRPTA